MATKTRKFNGKVYKLVKSTQNKVGANKCARGIRNDGDGSLARVTSGKVKGEKVTYHRVWKRQGGR